MQSAVKSVLVSSAILGLTGICTLFVGCSDEACHTQTGCDATHGAGGEATGTGGAGAGGTGTTGGGGAGGVAAGGEGGAGGG